MSQTSLSRSIMICALVVLGVSLIGGIISVLPVIGKITLGPNTSWINTFVIGQSIWRLPIEFYIAIVALILLAIRSSTAWNMILSTLLLAINLGMIRSNPSNILLWIMIAVSIVALCVSSAFSEGGVKVFFREFSDTIKQLRQRPTAVWKMVAAMLAVAFILNFMHNKIVKQSSEEARDARLVEWYKDARNKANAIDGIEIKIFTDYQCPACSQNVPKYLETALNTGNDAVRIILRDYPLDTACNDSPMFSMHPAACSAAYAVRLVEKEKTDEIQDFRSWLYTNQSKLNDYVILQRLKKIGINNPKDMFDEEINKAVSASIQEARTYGISSIPSVVLNNVLLPAGLNPSKLELLLKSELSGNASSE